MDATKREKLRDLAIFLAGAAASKQLRERILGAIEPEWLCKELADLFRGFKFNDGKPIREWFSARGATIEHGKDAVQAAIDCIRRDVNQREVDMMLFELKHARDTGSRKVFADKLRECAAKLEEDL